MNLDISTITNNIFSMAVSKRNHGIVKSEFTKDMNYCPASHIPFEFHEQHHVEKFMVQWSYPTYQFPAAISLCRIVKYI